MGKACWIGPLYAALGRTLSPGRANPAPTGRQAAAGGRSQRINPLTAPKPAAAHAPAPNGAQKTLAGPKGSAGPPAQTPAGSDAGRLRRPPPQAPAGSGAAPMSGGARPAARSARSRSLM